MSIQQNFPATRPSLNLNFSRSQKLDPRITFTRTSSATRVNSDGLIEVVPANSPRFDFDPISGESLGLLVEEQRTNLYVFSENPESAFFQPELVSFSSNSAIAPDGNLTADKIISPVGANGASISQGITISSGATLTGSAFVKYAELDRLEIVLLSNNNTTPYARATINPINGTITTAVAAFNGGTNPSASVVAYGNGWYRFSVTVTYPAVTLAGMRVAAVDSGGSLGDGTKGTFVWGMQLEQGSFPTSYIPTTNSTATRTADNASITGSNFSDFYNPSEGTFNIKYNRSLLPIGPILGQNISTSSVLNGYLINQSGTGNVIITNADGLTNITVGTSSGGKSSVAFYYSPTGHSGCLNGNSVIESLVPPTRTPVSLLFGRNPNNNNNLNGHIAQLIYYPSRLPNDQLITLTK